MKKRVAVLILICATVASGLLAQTQLERGRELLNQGKTREAIAALRQVTETTPKERDAWLLLGEAYLKVSNLDSAKIAGQRAISLDEANRNGYLLVAKVELAQKDKRAAYNTLNAGLAEKKNDPLMLAMLGQLLLEIDSVDRAIIILTLAKEVEPNSSVVYEGLGDAYARHGVTPYAITQYERSLELDTTRAGVHYKLASLYYKERRYSDAAREYLRVIALDTTNENAHYETSRLYFAARQYANATRFLRLYLDRFPQSKNADEIRDMYMESLFSTRQYGDALSVAENIFKKDPRSIKTLRIIAVSQSRLKKHKEAIDSYGKLRALDTLKVDDLKNLGEAYSVLKKDSLVAATYEEVLRLDPSDGDAYADAGAAYMRLRDWDRASTMFRRRYLSDSSASSLSSYLNYALCKMQLNDPDSKVQAQHVDSARVALRYFISKRPDYAPAHLYLARTLVALESWEEARASYEEWLRQIRGEEAKANKRELAEAYKIIGVSYLLEKKYPPAIENLKKSVSYRDDDWQPHLWLGQSYQLTGENEEAIKEYQRVLKLDPKNKDAKTGLERLGIPVD